MRCIAIKGDVNTLTFTQQTSESLVKQLSAFYKRSVSVDEVISMFNEVHPQIVRERDLEYEILPVGTLLSCDMYLLFDGGKFKLEHDEDLNILRISSNKVTQ